MPVSRRQFSVNMATAGLSLVGIFAVLWGSAQLAEHWKVGLVAVLTLLLVVAAGELLQSIRSVIARRISQRLQQLPLPVRAALRALNDLVHLVIIGFLAIVVYQAWQTNRYEVIGAIAGIAVAYLSDQYRAHVKDLGQP